MSYPVLRMDLSAEHYDDLPKLRGVISDYLSEWEKSYGADGENKSLSQRFYHVIQNAYNKSGKKRVVILIDEYDQPMLENLNNDEKRNEIRGELQGFYSVLKKADEFIRFAMITGVTKFTHVDIFSGLNNLMDISLMDDYNDICGVSESEFKSYFSESVKIFAEKNSSSISEVEKKFKNKYDGYHFSKKGEGIYNPFSLLKAFASGDANDYWFQSGTPSFLADAVKDFQVPAYDFGEAERTADQLMDQPVEKPDLYTILFQSGYLTIKGYNRETEEYRLGFPNEEVKKAFWQVLYRYFIAPYSSDNALSAKCFAQDLESGDINGFMARLQSIVASSNHGQERRMEVHFRNVISIVFHMLGYWPNVEVPVAAGFTDLVVKVKNYIYIFEFKIDSTPAKALEQIERKGYQLMYGADKRKVILIGAVFSKETGHLERWEYKSIS